MMPLLSRRLEVDTVVVRGLELNLGVAPDGTTNWADLTDDGERTAAADTPETGAGPGASGGCRLT